MKVNLAHSFSFKNFSKKLLPQDGSLLPLSEAAEDTPYGAEYLSLLARRGKLPARKINNVWYVTRADLNHYVEVQQIRNQVQQGNLDVLNTEVPGGINLRTPVSGGSYTGGNGKVLQKIAGLAFALVLALNLLGSVYTNIADNKIVQDFKKTFIESSSQLAAAPLAGDILKGIAFFFDGFKSLGELALNGFFKSGTSSRVVITLNNVGGSNPSPSVVQSITSTTTNYSLTSIRDSLKTELESYVKDQILLAQSPVVIYQQTSPDPLLEERLFARLNSSVTRQSDSDSNHASTIINNILTGTNEFTTLCINGDCRSSWSASNGNGGTADWAFTKLSTGEQSTSTTLAFLNGFISTASTTISGLTLSDLAGSGVKCLQVDNNGLISTASSNCGSGGGSGGGSWATTTSQVAGQYINYSLNNSDIIAIGNTSTTSAKFYFDPNALFAKIGGQLLVSGSTTLQSFTATTGTTTNATSSSFAITNLSNSLLAVNANGTVVATTSIGNNQLQNSTISGVALGGTLNSLTATDATLTFSGAYNGSAARTVGLNLNNSNAWTTLQTFTNSSSTLFSSQYASTTILCISGDCRTSFPAALTFAWPFTKLSTNEQATSTTLAFLNGFVSTASSTLTSFTSTNASSTLFSSTIASTSQLQLSGKKDAILSVDANGWVVASSSIGNNQLQNSTISGVSLGGTLFALTAGSTLTSAGTYTGATARTFDIDLTHANSWTGLQTFTNSSSTLLSSQYASTTILCISNDCRTAFPTFSMSFAFPFTTLASGENATSTTLTLLNGFYSNASSTVNSSLLVAGSTTLQNFTATNSTTTSATTTNLAISSVTSKLLKTNADGTVSGATAGTDYLASMSFAFPFTKQANGDQATSTTLAFLNGFFSNASSTINSTLLVAGSTTLQAFTAVNGTTTNATSTNLATTNFLLSGASNGCAQFSNSGLLSSTGVACGSGGGLPWPFTKQASGAQATTTVMEFIGGFLSDASSTLTDAIIMRATTTSATTTTNYVSGLTTSLNLLVNGSSTLQNFTGQVGTLTSLTATGLAGSGTKCVQVDNTGLLSLAGSACGSSSGSAGGSWATTTSQVAGQYINYSLNNSDIITIGNTATTSAKFYFDPNALFAKIGGDILVTGSTTLQNFTAQSGTITTLSSTNGTITNASSTLFSSTIASTSQLQLSGKKDAILSVDANGWVVASTSIGNNQLQNSTISGVSLGGTLFALTAGSTLTSAGTYTGATARTFDIDLTHANAWTGLQTFTNSSSTLLSSTIASTSQLWLSGFTDGCLQVSGSKVASTGSNCLSSMTFAFPFTKQGDGYQATSTGILLTGGLVSNASSTIGAGAAGTGLTILGGATTTGQSLVLGSTTLQAFTAFQGTVTSGTSTNLYAQNYLASGSTTLQAFTATNGTITTLVSTNASSTLFSSTIASTSQLQLSGKKDAILSVDANGWVVASTSIGNNQLQNSTISGVSLGGTLFALTAGSTLTSAGTYTGATARTFDIDLTHANSWTGLQTFTNSSSTLLSSTIASTSQLWLSGFTDGCLQVSGSKVASTGSNCLSSMTFAFPFTKQGDGYQATSTGILLTGGLVSNASSTIGAGATATGLTILGGATTTGQSLVLGSTTLQAFTAFQGTVTSGTSTNLYAQNYLASGSTTLQAFTATNGTITTLVSTNASSTLFSSTIASTSQLQLSGKKDAILSVDANGWVVASTSIGNNQLQNSTISGVSLGGTLFALTAGSTLTSAGTYTGATARTFDIDLTHANSWTGLQTFTNSSSTLLSSTIASTSQLWLSGFTDGCLQVSGSKVASTGSNCLSSMTFAFPFTKQGDGYQATSTGILLTGGLVSNASSTIGAGAAGTGLTILGGATTTGQSLVLGSTTLQAFTAFQGTVTSGTSTNLYAQNYLASGSTTLQAFTATNGTITTLVSTNASSTLFSSTIASTSQLQLSGKKDAILSVDANGWVVASTSIGNNQLQNSTISGVSLGGTLFALTAGSTLTSAGTYTGATARTFDIDLTHANSWTGLQTFTNSSSTLLSSTIASTSQLWLSGFTDGCLQVSGSKVASTGSNCLSSMTFAFPFTKQGDGYQATSTGILLTGGLVSNASSTIGAGATATGLTILGGATTTGQSLVLGSTTLQAFTAFQGTVTSGTSTNLYAQNYLASGSTTLQAFTATNGTITTLVSTNASSTLFSSTIASTSQLWLSGASDGCLQVSGSKVSSTGSSCGGSMTFAWPFTKQASGNQATSTTLEFNNGLLSTASSTFTTSTYLAALTGFVGIGTTSPTHLLTISSSSAPQLLLSAGENNSNQFAFRNSNGIFYLATSSPTSLATSSTAAFTIDGTTGYVGIGVNAPVAPLVVNSANSGGNGGYILVRNGAANAVNNSVGIVFNTASNASMATANARIKALQTDSGGGASMIFTNWDGSAEAEHLRITNMGLVGIGTTTPAYQLTLSSSTGQQLALTDGGATNNPFTFRNVGSTLYIGTSSRTSNATSTSPILVLDGTTGVATANQGLRLTGAADGCAQFTLSGLLSSTGVACGSGGGLPWPFTKQGDNYQATSTGMLFSGGFVSTASTTIGNNTTATGLTIFGGATTTNNFLVLGSTTLQSLSAVTGTTTSATSTDLYVSGLASTTNLRANTAFFGNVGIGTTNPTARLEVNNAIKFSGAGSGNAGNINWGTGYGAAALTLFDGGAGLRYGWGLQADEMQFFIPNASAGIGRHFSWNNGGDLQTSGTNEIMRLTWDGKLGIGTTTPTHQLTVASSSAPQLLLSTGGNNNQFAFRNSNGILYIATSSPTSLATSTTALLTIDGTTGVVSVNQGLRLTGAADGCAQFSSNGLLSSAGSPCGTAAGATFTYPFTTLGTGEQATSTTLALLNGFFSNASSTVNSSLLVTGSTTLQAFFATTGTTTSATSTNLATTNFLLFGASNGCAQFSNSGLLSSTGVACGSGGGLPWEWTKQTGNEQATSTIIEFIGGLLANASSTFTADVKLATQTGFVGIGTTSPTHLLTISSSTAPQLLLSTGGNNNAWAFRNSDGTLYLATSSPTSLATSTTAQFMIEGTNGNVGINTTLPTSKLTVSGTGGGVGISLLALTSSDTWGHGFRMNNTSSGGDWQFYTAGSGNTVTGSKGFYLYDNNASATRLAITNTGAFGLGGNISDSSMTGASVTINTKGFVGIGTTTPAYQLTIASSTGAQLALTDGGATNNPFTFRNQGSALYIGTSSRTSNATSTNPMFVLDGTTGNIAIGTSSTAAKLGVYGSLQVDASTTLQSFTATNGTITTLSSTNGTITNASTTLLSSTIASTSQLQLSGKKDAILSVDANGWVVASSSIGNNQLQNSTISGIALGGTLANLTATDGTLTFSGTYTGATARTIGLALNNANAWTALQTFSNASSTIFSSTIASTSQLTVSGQADGCASFGNSGLLTSTGVACGSGGGLPWEWTKQGSGAQATSTIMQFIGGFMSDASSTLSSDVRLATNSGFVGIGTSTPFNLLTLATSTGPQLALSAGADVRQWVFANYGGDFFIASTTVGGFATTTTNALTISANGNVGIGIKGAAGPYKLRITNDLEGGKVASFQAKTDTGLSTTDFLDNGGVIRLGFGYGNTGAAAPYAGTNYLSNISTDFVILGGSGTSPLATFKYTGNIGIGTTTPNHLLTLSSSTAAQLLLSTGGNNNQFALRNSNGILYLATSSPTSFATSTTPALTVDGTTGYVGVGTAAPGANLDVNGVIRTADGNSSIAAIGVGQSNIGFYQINDEFRTTIQGTDRSAWSSTGSAVTFGGGTFFNIKNNTAGSQVEIENNSSTVGNNGLSIGSFVNSASVPAYLTLAQSKSGSLGGQTAVALDSLLGQVDFEGSDGSVFQQSSEIIGAVDGAVSSGVVPGRLVFQTASIAGTLTDAMRITSSQLIGIGTSTPNAAQLTVSSSTGVQLALSDGSATSNPFTFRNVGSTLFVGTSSRTSLATSTRNFFTLDGSTGTIGFGTSTPRGIMQIAGTNMAQILLSDSGLLTSNQWALRNSNGVLYFATSSPTSFATSSLATLSLDGTTGTVTANTLDVGSSAGTGDAAFQFAGDINAWTMGYYSTDKTFRIASSTNLTANVYFQIGKSGTTTLNSGITTNTGGNYLCIDTATYEITRGNGSACTASSARFKENINNLGYGLNEVMQMRPVSFTYKPEMNSGTSTHLGFIAEEVEQIIPELVTYSNSGQIQGLDYPTVSAVLAKAIQELNLNIESLASNASSTATTTPASQAFADRFFSNIFGRITTWLADATNGIGSIFANKVNTKELCVSDDTGGQTCITKAQLDALLAGAVASGGGSVPPAPSPAPAPTPSPTGTSTPPTSTSTPPVIDPTQTSSSTPPTTPDPTLSVAVGSTASSTP